MTVSASVWPVAGEPGTNGGERGDLLVEAVVSKHPVFVRKDMNIYSTVPISFAKAALGGPIIIKTVDGRGRVRSQSRNPDRHQGTSERQRCSVLKK